jgi:hypothetical protein
MTGASTTRCMIHRGARSGVGVFALIVLAAGCLVSCGQPAPPNDAPNWQVEEKARPSKTHPLAGFWKAKDCRLDAGLAIGPMGERTYYVSFCGPGGCFAEGTYRPETTLYGDPTYRVIDENTIEVVGWLGTRDRYVRCPGRERPR